MTKRRSSSASMITTAAVRVAQGLLELGVQRAHPPTQPVEHLEGERRVAAKPHEQRARVQHQQMRLPHRRRVGIARQRLEQRHLPEEVAGAELGEHDGAATHRPRDAHASALDHVHLGAVIARADDQVAVRHHLLRLAASHRPA